LLACFRYNTLPSGACAFLLELVLKHLPLASPVTCEFKYPTFAVVLALLMMLLSTAEAPGTGS